MRPENNAELPLPCRGCTRDCPNISVCDHRPWRCAPGAYPDADVSGSINDATISDTVQD